MDMGIPMKGDLSIKKVVTARRIFLCGNDQSERNNVRLLSGLRAVVSTQQLTVRDRE